MSEETEAPVPDLAGVCFELVLNENFEVVDVVGEPAEVQAFPWR